MKKLLMLAVPLMLADCTPADTQYCNSFGVYVGHAEYAKCIDYYHQQDAQFSADADVCAVQADATYPRSLYDVGHSGFVHSYDPYRGFSHIEHVDIAPDYQHNAQVDALRMRIIAPCMDARGWNSPTSWQAGRHAVKPARPHPAPTRLPWLQNPAPASSGSALPWLKQ